MHVDLPATNEKNMKGLVGGPLLVEGLGSALPLKSDPDSYKRNVKWRLSS